ncbi:MAG: hypothetical protein ACOY3Y_00095 [Acidobacteriota bacterium]
MTRSLAFSALVLFASLTLAPRRALAADPDTAGMERLFQSLEKAIRDAQEPPFKKGWHPEGYAKNLVGGSGLPGAAVFKQGTRKQWYLKPDLKAFKTTGRGAPYLVPCDIWSWKQSKAVDHVWAALIYQGRAWVILGAGEKLEEVEALAKRYQAKKPLAAPAK